MFGIFHNSHLMLYNRKMSSYLLLKIQKYQSLGHGLGLPVKKAGFLPEWIPSHTLGWLDGYSAWKTWSPWVLQAC